MDRQGITARTKLQAPPLRTDLVKRARISKLIHRAADAKLVIVSAPPGFGKTTSLAALAHEDKKTAWLSLDVRDRDSSRFWLNVVQALREVEPGIGAESVEMFGSTDPQHLGEGVLSLCNDMAAIGSKPLRRLVLDDYNVIDNATIHDTLNTLIGHMPAGWQLLITTRSNPPLSIPALRARGQLCEIGPDDLRFSDSETHRFFDQTGNIDLAENTLTTIGQRTEGWAAALQLLAISLRTADDRDQVIREFTGDNRMIADYFNAEVLAIQSKATQRFLMVSAITERICAPLAQSLMDELAELRHEDAYSMLENLEQAQLFLIPLDQRRQWYRYHHLFHNLLREQARRELSEQLPLLRRKAADWLEQNLHYDDAIQLWLQMEDYSGCERVIWLAAQQYFPEGQFFKLREWLRLLPIDCIGTSPKLVFLASLIAFNVGQPREAKKWLGLLVKLTSENPEALQDDPVLAAELRGFSLFAEAWVDTNRNNSLPARANAPQVGKIIGELENPSPGTVARLNLVYGELLFQAGQLAEARNSFRQGITACREWGYGIFAGSLYTRMAATYRVAGALRQMTQTAEEGLGFIDTTRASGRLEASGYLQQFIGESHMERYQLDRAFEILYEIHIRAQRAQHYLLQVISGLSLTTVMRCRGQSGDAVGLSKENFEIASHHDIKTWYMPGPGPTYVRALIQTGDIDGAAAWVAVNKLTSDDNFDFLQEFEYLTLSRVQIARKDYDSAGQLLTRIRSQSQSGGRYRVTLEASLLSSVLSNATGDKAGSLEHLDRALDMASRETYIRMFLDEGPGLIRQLREIPDSNPNHAFVRKVLALAPQERDYITRMTALGPEILSKRELEVMQLISEGCSNRAVAAKLFLSPHTVKAHTRNIYDKLAVTSRTQAVAKAASLGLILRGH